MRSTLWEKRAEQKQGVCAEKIVTCLGESRQLETSQPRLSREGTGREAPCLMRNERAMSAESVSEVLAMARQRQLSGRLTIRPQRRGSSLEGVVSLQAGRPVSARLGLAAGHEALSRLLGWRAVQYLFQPDDPAPASPGLRYESDTDEPSSPAPSDGKHLTDQEAPRTSAPGPNLAQPVPHRREVDRDVLTLPLTRRQRVIYLLVDGQRTLVDLSRCSGQTQQEVEWIVQELQAKALLDI
jgi:Domain of unknown function (DUF4388)